MNNNYDYNTLTFMSYSFPEKCDLTGSTPRTLKISLFLLMQVRERGDHKGLGEHGPLTTVTGSFVRLLMKIERSNASRKGDTAL